MRTEKGIELIGELVANRFSLHKIEKDLDIANGTLGKVMAGRLQLSDINYRKIQSYFIAKLLKMEPDADIQQKLEKFEELKNRVIELEKENISLKAQLNAMQPISKPFKESSSLIPAPLEAAKNDEILAKIKAIRDEKCPKERDTPIGRKSWELDQKKRIEELKQKLH
jgi:vacuolar-type H+-ATPase subunit I/STV1